MIPRGQVLSLAEAVRRLPSGKEGSVVLYRARVYDACPDGLRVLVDGVWPRGIPRQSIDVWAKELAPSVELRKAYGHRPEKAAWFRQAYRQELQGKTEAARQLLRLAAAEPVVLLYAARDDTLTNGVVLWEFLQTMASFGSA